MSQAPHLTPNDLLRPDLPRKMRGYEVEAVDQLLELAADELTARLADLARLEQENRNLLARLDDSSQRQQELQEALLHAQRLSKTITDSARHESDVLLREAQVTADHIVSQAIEQAGRIEGKLTELRTVRRELQLKFRNSLDLYREILDADMADERSTAVVRTLPRRQAAGAARAPRSEPVDEVQRPSSLDPSFLSGGPHGPRRG